MLCSNSNPFGVVILGGSACSHFEIPVQWIEANKINSSTYDDVLFAIENELDWPQRSWATGWDTSDPDIPVDSLYLRVRARNQCNHRDFQNIAVNGDNTNKIVDTVKLIHRNQETDYPAIVIYSPFGDDVCNMDVYDTISHMTTPAQFTTNVLTALNYLDTILPNGSHVMFVGLVQGTVLWDFLYNHSHPMGGGVTYEDVYTWLLCLNANPCVGWLNPNETLRNETQAIADVLSMQYSYIVGNYTFKNFDMAYYPSPVVQLINQWVSAGGNATDLIEPVDGFHPSQQTQALMGAWTYNTILQDHPSWLGEVNPFNSLITTLFGNQGGY